MEVSLCHGEAGFVPDGQCLSGPDQVGSYNLQHGLLGKDGVCVVMYVEVR